MPASPDGETLSKTRYVTVLLRLLVDQRGRVIHGEVVDVEGRTAANFTGWRGLTRAVRARLGHRE